MKELFGPLCLRIRGEHVQYYLQLTFRPYKSFDSLLFPSSKLIGFWAVVVDKLSHGSNGTNKTHLYFGASVYILRFLRNSSVLVGNVKHLLLVS